jgi:hypothetical protein
VSLLVFHQRKKHGETVPPLKIPRKFYGVGEYLVPYSETQKSELLKVYICETCEGKLVVRSSHERQNGCLVTSAAQQHGEYARKSWVKSSILIIPDL